MSEMPASAPMWLDLPEERPNGRGRHSGEAGSQLVWAKQLAWWMPRGQGLCWYLWEGLPGPLWVTRTIRGPLTLPKIAKDSLILGH